MTAFKTFFKIVKSYRSMIILYSVLLIFFTGFNMQTSDTTTDYVADKPDIVIINKDSDNKITNNLINYLSDNADIIKMDEDKISDALFYRDVDYIIYIPKNYYVNYNNGLNPEIEVKTTSTYQSSLAKTLLNKYIKVANVYQGRNLTDEELINQINNSLKETTTIEVVSTLNTNTLTRMSFYYDFLNYTILAGCVYIICLILSCYREEKIRRRITVSKTNYKVINRQLLLGNGILAFGLWFAYNVLALILIGKDLISMHGLILMINSLLFTFCSLTLAFLIGNLISSKNAINGIINVISLGSSFLCGAFVPASMLPDSVLAIAHILPSYWYINSNDLVKTLEVINLDTLKPIFENMFMILLFSLLFIILSNIASKCKRRAE